MDISTDKSLLNVSLIHEVLTNSYWAKGRTKEAVARSIKNSYCFGGYRDGKQVAFARVISDEVVFAYIMDVFVSEEVRGLGYGEKLMKAVLDFEPFAQVKQWHLKTMDAHAFYAQLGFEKEDRPEIWMKKI